MMDARIIAGDALSVLRTLQDESVQCCVTSPPYWGLRDYGSLGQLGLERTPEEYVSNMVLVFREVRRVLRPGSTLWLNMGDCYAGSWGAQSRGAERAEIEPLHRRQVEAYPAGTRTGSLDRTPGLKAKDLIGMPWRLAFALQADGWWLRSDIIWAKPNPMPESVRDRPTKAHEYVFLLANAERYYYDAEAIREPDLGTDHRRSSMECPSLEPSGGLRSPHGGIRTVDGRNGSGRNARDVWSIASQPFRGAHFAVFPEALAERCVLAGSPELTCECGAPLVRLVSREFHPQADVSLSRGRKGCPGQKPLDDSNGWNGFPRGSTHTATIGFERSCECGDGAKTLPGVVLDPFAGSGTTGVVALRHRRRFIGIELNEMYCEMAERRILEATRQRPIPFQTLAPHSKAG
jgi:DNA modification methylase